MVAEKEKVVCDFCGQDKTEILYKLESPDFKEEFFNLEKCKNCGLSFINPRPFKESIKKYYPDTEYYAYSQAEEDFEKQDRSIVKKLAADIRKATIAEYYAGEKKYPFGEKLKNKIFASLGKHRFGTAPPNLKTGSIFDVGCGDGHFLSYLKDLGWSVSGLEINTYACQKAGERGIEIYNQDLLDADFGDKTFDVVRLWSVIEHLYYPRETIKKINQILRKDGILIIQTPNIESAARRIFKEKWSAFDAPRHLYSFSKETLKKMIEKNNFEILKIHTISVGTVAASLKRGHSFLSPFLFLFDMIMDGINAGDCLVCYAKKK